MMAEGKRQKAEGVPEGWQFRALGELLTNIQGGFSVNASDSPANEGQVGILKLSSVLDGFFRPEQNKAVGQEDLEYLSVFPKADSVIISRANTKELVGMCGYVTQSFPTLFLPDLLWQLHGNPEKVCMQWLSYWLSSPQGRDKVTSLAAGSNASMVKINKESFKKLSLLLPPLPEQKKIAAILSTWDDSLATLAQLIAAKRQQKRGLAEALLTGKKRLPGFEGEWEAVRLGDVFQVHKGMQKNKASLSGVGNYPVINGGITPSGYSDEFNTEGNTVTISEGGNSCGFVAFQEGRFWCGGHCYAMKSDRIPVEFQYQILKGHESQIMALRVGSGLPNIQKKSLEAFELRLPKSLKEQQAIASILSTLDGEIASLEALKAKVQEQKRGLMDELLTGRVRVKVEEEC